MVEAHRSYQSHCSGHDVERSPLMIQKERLDPIDRSSSSVRRIPRSVLWIFPVIALMGVLLYVSTSFMPTEDEMELAREFEVSLGGIQKIRSAQLLADSSLLTGRKLHHKRKHIKKFFKKIEADPEEGCEATVILVRHCEKGYIREHCSYPGYERSVYLASLFGDDDERWPAPYAIFAENPHRHGKKMNFREMELVAPTSMKLKVPVDSSYSTHNVNHLAEKILTNIGDGRMCGRTVLVSWKHSNIGHLARHLGCGPSQGCPMDYRGKSYDAAWLLKFVYTTFDHSTHKKLKLPEEPEWRVFGSVQAEGFDPLAFSKKVGDYPPNGTSTGARWKASAVEFPERDSRKDTKSWKQEVPVLLGGTKESKSGR